uniref:Myb/SANT-like domain-containing protein n=1 Tax=Triticum urartu TaxID=4572 RepID=A0A8R7NXJ7_TRIUA
MSDLDLVAYINEENKRRKSRRIVLTKLYFESFLLGIAYLSTQRAPRDLGSFTDDEEKNIHQKYLLKGLYDGAEVTCYDQLRLTKRNFHDLCTMLRERAGQSGFGWDWINNKLSIDSEDVWIKYVAANQKVGFYKNKVIKNWDAITTIYSKDHANGEGAVTGAETVVEPTMEPNEASPEVPHKKQRTGDAILCLLGDMKGSFNDALKSLEPLPLPQVTPPAKILATLEMILDLARGDILRSYGKLILRERLYQALLELPMNFRKEWLLMLE